MINTNTLDFFSVDKTIFVENSDYQTEAQVKYDGSIFWTVPVVFRSYCSIDMSHYPFDNQTCMLRFWSWAHRTDEIDLVPTNPNIEVCV